MRDYRHISHRSGDYFYYGNSLYGAFPEQVAESHSVADTSWLAAIRHGGP